MTDLGLALSKTIGAARKKRGLSQRELMQKMGFYGKDSRSYVTRLETAVTRPTLETLERLAGALDTSVSNLIANAEKRARRIELGRLACGQNGSINQSGNQGEAAGNG